MEDGLTLREEVTLRYIANASENITKFKGKDWVECSCGTLMPVLKAARNTVYRTLKSLESKQSRFMVACYQKVFKSLGRWREYVRKLSRSGYIMNKIRKCGYFLRWALSFKVINKIYEGGFGVGGAGHLGSADYPGGVGSPRGVESGEEEMTKANKIAVDILSDSVMKIYKRYENDREARELIAEFIECYGKYEAVTVFSNAGIHLRGKRLRLYFGNLFHMNRFLIHCRYDRFIEYCEKRYDFKVELESSKPEEMPQIDNSLKFA